MKSHFFLFLLKISIGISSKLSESACDIVSEQFLQNKWMKTVAIAKFEHNFHPQVVDSLIQCMPASVIVIDVLKFNMNQPRIHNADIVVMIVDNISNSAIVANFFEMVLDLYFKPFLNHNSKFLALTLNAKMTFFEELKKVFYFLSITNYAIITEMNSLIIIDRSNYGQSYFTSQVDPFPNQLAVYKKQVHKIVVYLQPPRVDFVNEQLRSKMFYFLKVITNLDDSTMNIQIINDKTLDELKKIIFALIESKNFHMTVNDFTLEREVAPKLITYEETGYCAIVPFSIQTSNTGEVFLNPFDPPTWLLIVIMISLCMILWRLGGHSTIWFIPFFFWTFYHGQSVDFPTNRKIFVILLQILVFGMFFHGNVYQGVITSLMMVRGQPERLNSLDELLESDHKIFVEIGVNKWLMENANYRKAFDAGRILTPDNLNWTSSVTTLGKTAALVTCENAKLIASNISTNFYMIDTKLFSHYTRLHFSYLNKYLRRWQMIMDWCFEGGLPQAWEKFVKVEKYFKDVEEIDEDILTFDDFINAYYPLVYGLISAAIALVCEIFWHDFVKEYYKILKIKLHEMRFGKNKKTRRKKVRKVRRIQVQPIGV